VNGSTKQTHASVCMTVVQDTGVLLGVTAKLSEDDVNKSNEASMNIQRYNGNEPVLATRKFV
jgi:hypothetical protein